MEGRHSFNHPISTSQDNFQKHLDNSVWNYSWFGNLNYELRRSVVVRHNSFRSISEHLSDPNRKLSKSKSIREISRR